MHSSAKVLSSATPSTIDDQSVEAQLFFGYLQQKVNLVLWYQIKFLLIKKIIFEARFIIFF